MSKFSNFSIDYILGESTQTQTPAPESPASVQSLREDFSALNLLPSHGFPGAAAGGAVVSFQTRCPTVYDAATRYNALSCCGALTLFHPNYSMNYCGERCLHGHPDCDREESHCYQATHHRQRNRIRTVFTENQTRQLDQLFSVTEYPSAERRAELAKNTGLSEEIVRVWFKNRRARRKRQRNTNGPTTPTNGVQESDLFL